MATFTRVQPNERSRLFLLAVLFAVNAVVRESNEVFSTTGIAVNVGVPQILWVWAANMAIVMVLAGAISLIVDRASRGNLAIGLFVVFSLLHVGCYFLFNSPLNPFASYFILSVINEQQFILFPLLIWALANDMFSLAEAKRLFPLLGMAVILGSVIGNTLAGNIARWVGGRSTELLLLNAWLLLMSAVYLAVMMPRMQVEARQSRPTDTILDALREGLGFVREVPAYRFLTLAMILIGLALNVIEYRFLANATDLYGSLGQLPLFYGYFKVATTVVILGLQGIITTWLLNRIGFKYVFFFMPGVMLVGLLLALFWAGISFMALPLTGTIIGDFLARVTQSGIDEPARRAFQGLVPDERRGRVSTFLEGYLYPLGSLIGCGLIGFILFAGDQHWLAPATGVTIYLGIGIGCAVIAVWAISRFLDTYDASMLNWRLKRRKRGSPLDDVEF